MGFYTGRKVLITGGSAGIGLATACRLAADGADVCVAARGIEQLDAAVAAMKGAAGDSGRVLTRVVMDVSDDASVQAGMAAALEELGGLHVLINNAGYALPDYIERLEMSHYEAMMQVNYLGAVRVIREVLPHFMSQRSGNIANVTSMLGFMGMFGYAAYSGSKYALSGYTECLRQDMLPYGVGVHLCYPPTTKTPGLERENETKPPESWAIEGKSRAFPPQVVAQALLAGIQRGRFEILVGMDSALIWRAQRFAPAITRWVMDNTLRGFIKKSDDKRWQLSSSAMAEPPNT